MKAHQIVNFSMQHGGHCYRNSNLNPASAEEPHAVRAARALLLDADGNYVGDDLAIFGDFIHADNDTRAPKAFIAEQNRIMGEAVDNLADHSPDKGHVLKCSNNGIHNLVKKDKSFGGKHGLTNLRISSLVSDQASILDSLKRNYEIHGHGHAQSKKEALEQLEALTYHHCGIHDKCHHEQWCTFTYLKNRHPDWSNETIAEQAAIDSQRPHEGQNMDLSEDGMEKLADFIMQRYKGDAIDKYARGGCSNLSENFWNINTKFSEGKRLNQDHSDLWIIFNELSFCRKGDGNVAKTHNQVSEKLSLPITSPEKKHLEDQSKKRKKEQLRQASPKYKQRRTLAKLTKDHKMGKLDSKKAHKSGKVPLGESAKSSVANTEEKAKRKPPSCSACGQHTQIVKCQKNQRDQSLIWLIGMKKYLTWQMSWE